MTNANRSYRRVAAFLDAVEALALLMAVMALLSMAGDGLDRLFGAFVF
jgi:hypothetical protein